MDEKEIKKFIEDTIKGTFSQIELSSKIKELEELKETNKQLVAKLASVDEAEIPAEKVDEITEIVDKAIGDKVDSAVGEALAQVVERVDEIESSMTNRQRIKKALSDKKSPFKAMSRPAKAFTEGSDIDVNKELEAINDKLNCAKDKKELEEVKNLLQAFISSASKKVKLSAEEDNAELEAYRELGTIDEIEAAVDVLEVYADEIGTLPELEAPEDGEDKEAPTPEEDEVPTDDTFDIEAFASKRRKALASRKKAIAKKNTVSSKKVAKVPAKKPIAKKDILARRKQALASKVNKAKASKKVELSKRVEKLRSLREKFTELSNSKNKENTKVELSSTKESAPGSLASSLFSQR